MSEQRLRELVEKTAGKQMQTPRDFEWLADKVWERTREHISPTTLKRMWGYLEASVRPRRMTLDLLAKFVGMADYDAFCRQTGETQSNVVLSDRLSAESLENGQRLQLRWQPDRRLVVRYLGNARFVVEESVNSKLAAGDLFDCHLFIAHEPLFMDNLVHFGRNHAAYVAGKKDGISFEFC